MFLPVSLKDPHKLSCHASLLSMSCEVFWGNSLATTGLGSCISGWHLYKKLYRNTCKNRESQIIMKLKKIKNKMQMFS